MKYLYLLVIADLACIVCMFYPIFCSIFYRPGFSVFWFLWSIIFYQITQIIRIYVNKEKWTTSVALPFWAYCLYARIFVICNMILLVLTLIGCICHLFDYPFSIINGIIGAAAAIIAWLYKRFNYIRFYPKPVDADEPF